MRSFLFLGLKQHLPDSARPNYLSFGAVQRLGPDARAEARHGIEVQAA